MSKREFQEAMEAAAVWHKRTPTEQAEFDRASAGAFPGGEELLLGDMVEHPEVGRCVVKQLQPEILLTSPSGAVIEVHCQESHLAPEAIIEGGQRLFRLTFVKAF